MIALWIILFRFMSLFMQNNVHIVCQGQEWKGKQTCTCPAGSSAFEGADGGEGCCTASEGAQWLQVPRQPRRKGGSSAACSCSVGASQYLRDSLKTPSLLSTENRAFFLQHRDFCVGGWECWFCSECGWSRRCVGRAGIPTGYDRGLGATRGCILQKENPCCFLTNI